MVLYLIGLGLGDENDITLKGLQAVRSCSHIFLEHYTAILTGVSKERLQAAYGLTTPIVTADREMVESKADHILTPALDNDVAFLVVGDPFASDTLHTHSLAHPHTHIRPSSLPHTLPPSSGVVSVVCPVPPPTTTSSCAPPLRAFEWWLSTTPPSSTQWGLSACSCTPSGRSCPSPSSRTAGGPTASTTKSTPTHRRRCTRSAYSTSKSKNRASTTWPSPLHRTHHRMKVTSAVLRPDEPMSCLCVNVGGCWCMRSLDI